VCNVMYTNISHPHLFPSSQSGDKPYCKVGDIVKALHPGLQCFCRARVVDVRKYKLPNVPARWIVKVRWCEYWTDEPDSTSVIEPTIAQAATIPQNKYLSFIQIVSNPFPYYPQYTEVYFQSESAAASSSSSAVNVNSWQPGFVVEENEYQYRVMYVNEGWKPHPLLAMEEGEGFDDEEKRIKKNATERARIKSEYQADLIRGKLKKDAKRREKIRKERQALVDTARAELAALHSPIADVEGGDEKHSDPIEIEQAQRKLDHAILQVEAMDEELLDFQEEHSDPESSSFSRPSISKQPDTSLIYQIDYPQLDPTFIYDPDLARLDENGEQEEEQEEEHGEMDDEAMLEMEMGRIDQSKPQHPSQWLDAEGKERMASMDGGAPKLIEQKSVSVLTKQKHFRKKSVEDGETGETGMGVGSDANTFGTIDETGGGFFSGEEDAISDSDEQEDSQNSDMMPERPPPLLTQGGTSYLSGARDPLIRSIEDQRSMDEWAVMYPKFTEAWVNKYSVRLKRQTSFYNTLYAKYLLGFYEETIEDKFFRAQKKMELLLEAERNKPKKWYHMKRDVEGETLKLMSKLEAQASKDEESARSLRDDTFEEDDTGLERVRRERYEKIVEQEHPWILEDELELDGDHLDDSSTSIIKHKRRLHACDKDPIWDSFMSESWVRYRYEYRDPNHPDYAGGGGHAVRTVNDRGIPIPLNKMQTQASLRRASSTVGGDKNVRRLPPRQFKWIWAQIQGKDSNEMVLFLVIPESLRKLNAKLLAQRGGKPVGPGKRQGTQVKIPQAMLGAGGQSGGQDKVILRKDDELGNSRKIKYYWDRVRRWQMDSYRRYQIELAQQGLFLIFINRLAIEANEDVAETEKEMNTLITQFQIRQEQENQKRLIATAAAVKVETYDAPAESKKPESRLARFNKRGSVIGRASVFSQLTSGGGGAMHVDYLHASQASREFASNHLTSEAGYGILGYDDMREDGNSLYRAVSLQLFGTQENYLFIKQQCIQHIAAHPAYYCGFLDINFEYYLSLKFRSLDPTQELIAYGDHLDLQAICEMYDVAVHIYSQIELGASGMAGGNAMIPEAVVFAATPTSSSSSSSSLPSHDSLLLNQPFIKFYDEVLPEGMKLPTIMLSYAGYGHYDAVKRRSTPWPLQTSLGFPVYTRTRIANVVLRARQRTEFEAVEKVRVEEARKAYELIATATANAPMGRTNAMKQAAKERKKAKLKRQVEIAAARAAGKGSVPKDISSESEEEDVTLETVIAGMANRQTRQMKPIDTLKMELSRTILQPRELVLSTYIGEVLFKGDIDVQTATFLDCLASCKIEYGTKKELLANGYHVQQGFSERFWHDMQMQSMSELVSQQNLEGLAAVAMYGQEDGAGGATTMTGEGLKLNLPRVIVMYPYYPSDAHLEGEELEEHRERMKGQKNKTGLPPLMLIEGVELAVEEMVRLVRRMAKVTKLVKTSQATWLPPQ
jgi:hypothetical protein